MFEVVEKNELPNNYFYLLEMLLEIHIRSQNLMEGSERDEATVAV